MMETPLRTHLMSTTGPLPATHQTTTCPRWGTVTAGPNTHIMPTWSPISSAVSGSALY